VARVRFAVALVIPPPVAAEIDGLRRALGVDTGYIPPHITLVPPVNVNESDVPDALAVLRESATVTASPLQLTIGPLDTFLPRTPVLFLSVSGELDRLDDLHRTCNRGPLHREERRAYVPHVTLTRRLAPDDDSTLRRLLGHFHAPVTIDRLHLLEQVVSDRGRHWTPCADAVFASRRVVGRGGPELELSPSALVDPQVRDLLTRLDLRVPAVRHASEQLVVAARRGGGVAGVAIARPEARTAWLELLVVEPSERLQGVGSHLAATLEHELGRHGVEAVYTDRLPADVAGLLRSRGWSPEAESDASGDVLMRRLAR
jgi:2'-5' RNA ligase/N-acetylglutamate synthase-like GNAT family acetyltransferase